MGQLVPPPPPQSGVLFSDNWMSGGLPVGVAAQPIESGKSGFVLVGGKLTWDEYVKLSPGNSGLLISGSIPPSLVAVNASGDPINVTAIQPKPPAQKNKPGELGDRKVEV